MKSRFQILSAVLFFAFVVTPSFGCTTPGSPAPPTVECDPEFIDPNSAGNPNIADNVKVGETVADPVCLSTGSYKIRPIKRIDWRSQAKADIVSWFPELEGRIVGISFEPAFFYLPENPPWNVKFDATIRVGSCQAVTDVAWVIPSEALLSDINDPGCIPSGGSAETGAKMWLPPGGPYTVYLTIVDEFSGWESRECTYGWGSCGWYCNPCGCPSCGGSERVTDYDWEVYGSWMVTTNGKNWQCPWIITIYVMEDDPNNVYLSDGQGAIQKWIPKEGSENEYVSPAGVYETMVKNQDGSYTITDKHGTVKRIDPNGFITEIEDRNGNKIIYTYTGSDYMRLLTKMTDDLGRDTTFTYNNKRMIDTVTDPAGRQWTYHYDSTSGDLLSVETPMGLSKSYTYLYRNGKSTSLIEMVVDPNGDTYLTNYYDNNDRVWKQTYGDYDYLLSYHPDVNMTTVTNRAGYDSNTVYNESGQALKEYVYTEDLRESDPNCYLTQHSYDNNGEITKKVFPAGNWIDYEYDGKGNTTKIVKEPNDSEPNIVMTFTYEPNFSFITEANDALGNVYTLDYNEANGNLEKITFPQVPVYGQGNVSPTITATYNQSGQIETVTLPDGIVYKCEYYQTQDNNDPNCGSLHKVIYDYNETDANALNIAYEYKWNMYNKVVEVKDPNGGIKTYDYNPLEKMTSFTNALEQVVRLGYNNNMMMTKVEREVTGDANQVTQFAYNILDKLTRITDPLGNVTRLGYDPQDNLSDVNDAEENNTHYDYDERDLLWKITDANGKITRFSYTLNGELAEVNDARGNITTYSYDGFDRLIKITYPDDTNEKFGYDKNSNVTSFTNRAGDTIHYQYDALRQMTVKSRPGEPNIYFSYDISGRLVEVNDLRPVAEGGGITSFKYDRLGRVIEVNDIDSRVVKYEYDSRGLRSKLTYPYSPSWYITYEYDSLRRLTNAKWQSSVNVVAYYYDQLGRRTSATFRNDSNAVYEYDIADRMTKLTNNVNASDSIVFDYNDYDKVGNRLGCKIGDANWHVYSYDELYQLTKVDYNDGRVTSYSYDALGNRIDVNENGTVTSYTTNSLNQYTSVGGVTYSYDDNGNLTNDGFYRYYYDCENRLTDVNYVNNSRVASYKYDWLGRRVRKIDYTLNPVRYTLYCYDGDQVIEEYNGDGGLLRFFVYGAGIDEPLVMYAVGSGMCYYHYDGLGSVVALSDSSGNIVEERSYDVFGEPSCISGVGNPYKFTGRRYDEETGLYYYRARYYKPEIGRFTSPDPITIALLMNYVKGSIDPVSGGIYISAKDIREFITKNPVGRYLAMTSRGRFLIGCQYGIFLDLNLYGYCGNNPIVRIDPYGLGFWKNLWGAKGIIGGFTMFMGGALTLTGHPYIGLPIFAAGLALTLADIAETAEEPPGHELVDEKVDQIQEQMDWLNEQENGKNCPQKQKE